MVLLFSDVIILSRHRNNSGLITSINTTSCLLYSALDLRLERRKTNQVLHTMLPRKIADELKFRKFVRPTYYDSVSMYFSDVQGFTALSSRSTPNEIVVMLTELYTKFDDILNDYKVWKLETIGDAYCVSKFSIPGQYFSVFGSLLTDIICRSSRELPTSMNSRLPQTTQWKL